MLEKWSIEHCEPEVAKAWASNYAVEGKEASLTRVEINVLNKLLGGWTNDSLIVESGNKTDKKLRFHRKKGAVVFVRETERHLCQESLVRNDFFGNMKRNVHSTKVCATVEAILNDARNMRPCFLNLRIPFVTTRDDLLMPPGSFVIPSRRSMLSEMADTPLSALSVESAQEFFTEPHQPGNVWYSAYCQLVNDPVTHVAEMHSIGFTGADIFDHLHDTVAKRFHCIRPLNPKGDVFMLQALDGLYHMLRNNKYGLIPLDTIVSRGNKGFVSCTCQLYLMRAWCHHSCAFAFARGLITSYPPNMDPRPAFVGHRRGRPGNIPKNKSLQQEPDYDVSQVASI